MNCTQVEKLLALYVGDDLAAERARAVTRHLRDCDGCRRLADEFVRSRSLLRLHEPPRFDAAFFEEIRNNVLREIGRTPARPTLFSAFRQFFAPRSFAFAAALALFIAAGALAAFQLYRRSVPDNAAGTNPARRDAAPQTAAGETTGASEKRESPRHLPEDIQSPESVNKLHGGVNKLTAQSQRAPSPRTLQRRRPQAAPSATHGAAPSAPPLTAQEQAAVSPRSREDAQPSAPTSAQASAQVNAGTPPLQEAAALTLETVASHRPMTRVELQTGDPNVRIIWLLPQTTPALSTQK
jgi:hypothetical protein